MLSLIKKYQETSGGWSIVIMRIAVGVIFFEEGCKKLFGWFGFEGGIYSVIGYFKDLGIPFPTFHAYLVGSLEFGGGALLILGLLTRFAALPLCCTMVVAILTAHLKGGWSYPLSLLVSTLVLTQYGGGRFSVDKLITNLLDKNK